MNITPKTFRALRDITIGMDSYAIGDVVPPGPNLARLLAYDGFVDDGKATPEAKPAKDTTPTTMKEGSDNAAS